MKIALIVGINYYEHGSPLFGCVNDANNVKKNWNEMMVVQ